jgi:hypothetical protein
MKRKLPSHIKVGGHTIDVVRQKNLLSHSEAYGMFDPTGLVITIDESLTNTLAWETLWHEVTEALNFFAEADMEHKSIQVFGLLLHQIVDSIFVKAPK